MVERSAVNRMVVGSSPILLANIEGCQSGLMEQFAKLSTGLIIRSRVQIPYLLP